MLKRGLELFQVKKSMLDEMAKCPEAHSTSSSYVQDELRTLEIRVIKEDKLYTITFGA